MAPTTIITEKTPFLTNAQVLAKAPAAGAHAPVDAASNRYSFVPTITVVDALRDIGWFPIEVNQSGVYKDGKDGFQRHMIRFSNLKTTSLKMENRIDLVLYNSHDLTSILDLYAGIFRKVCANGLIAWDKMYNFKHKHIGFNMDDFLESARNLAGSMGNISDRIEDMQRIELEPQEQSFLATSALMLRFPGELADAPVNPVDLLQPRWSIDRGKTDLWTTFNTVQENVIKGGLPSQKRTETGRKRKPTRPITALKADLELNKALWFLTESMAAIKRGADPVAVRKDFTERYLDKAVGSDLN